MSDFEELSKEVQRGLDGRNNGIPMGFERLNRYISIRKSIYTLVGGLTGSGKTSLVDDAFVLNPCDWYIKNKHNTDIKLKIIYRSMERRRMYKLAKWVGREMFINEAVTVSVTKLLGWNTKERLTKDEHDLFLSYKDYMNELQSIVTIIDGPENPVGIAKQIKEYAEENGKIEQLDKYNKIYIPNDPNLVTLIIIDHVGLTKTTKDHPTKKSAIDKLSNELQHARDLYGFSPIVVSQFNRDIANPLRIKNGDVEPQLEDNCIIILYIIWI